MEISKTITAKSDAAQFCGGIFIEKISQIEPEVLIKNEIELEQFFTPNPNDYFIRKRIWELKTKGDPIKVHEVYEGICNAPSFYDKMDNKYRVCWLLTPMSSFQDMYEESFYFLFKKLKTELLNLPVNEKTAGHLIKALDMFANRAIGPVVQRIEQKSMNVNVDGNQAMREVMTPDQLEQKFNELKSRLVALPAEASKVDEPQ